MWILYQSWAGSHSPVEINEETHTTHTKNPTIHNHMTKTHACNNNNTPLNTCMQQQQQQTHMYATSTTTIKNPTPRTIIGNSPHPPTCVWVGWVFI